MARTAALALALGVLVLAHAAAAQPNIVERATERTDSGLIIRGGSVTIEVDPRHCDPPCPGDQRCENVCRYGECDATSNAANPCEHCTWECVD
jgi:hypothetical protein